MLKYSETTRPNSIHTLYFNGSAKSFPKWTYRYIFLPILWEKKKYLFPRPVPSPYFTKNILPIWWTKYHCLLCISLIIVRWGFIYILAIFIFFRSFPHFSARFFFFFLNRLLGSLYIFWIEKGRDSGARLPVSEPCFCHLLTVTFDESPDFSVPQFVYLLCEVKNKPYLLGLL